MKVFAVAFTITMFSYFFDLVQQSCKIGAMDCLAQLCMVRGKDIISYLSTLISIAVKQSNRTGSTIPGRVSALRLAAAVVGSTGSDNRSWNIVQEEAFRLAERNSKVSNSLKPVFAIEDFRTCLSDQHSIE